MMIKPLTLGNKNFPVNIIQGPLAGISSSPFRTLTWRYSQPAFSCTEMISAKTLIYQSKLSHPRFVEKDPNEGPVCFQLASNNPTDLAEATKMATHYGADLIDLNCGCPVKKIRRKGAGSSLLTNATKLYQLICAMKQNTHVPVSIKIRVQGQSVEDEKFNSEIVKVVQDAGADFLIVHGRHWTEHYETPCRHDEIQFFVEQLNIPVIGNGDIACINSLQKMFATGCAGVMVGRAGVGQPWLIGQLMAAIQQKSFVMPTAPEIGLMFLEHVVRLAQLIGSERIALFHARRFTKYYARYSTNRSAVCVALNTCERIEDLKIICEKYFVS